MGLRLAGIAGEVVHEPEEILQALERVMHDPEIGVVLMTEVLIRRCQKKVYEYKLHCRSPLIVEIPDRHGAGDSSDLITEYLRDAIGISI